MLSLIKVGIIGNPYEEFSVLGAIVGSYLFGIGIVLAGGCATGTWYRAGEGLLGSWVALFFYMISAAAMKSGFLVPLNQLIAKRWVINDDLAGQLGIPVWYFLVLLVAITGDSKQLGWGVFLVLGIFLGSFLAAKVSLEFRWRLPDLSTIGKSTLGGIFMGIGASWAGGCTIGNGLTATAIFSSKGWIALPVTILGVWTASYIIFVKPNKN